MERGEEAPYLWKQSFSSSFLKELRDYIEDLGPRQSNVTIRQYIGKEDCYVTSAKHDVT